MVPPARDPAGLADVRAARGRVGLRGHLRGDAHQARHVPGRLGDRPALQDLPVRFAFGFVLDWVGVGRPYLPPSASTHPPTRLYIKPTHSALGTPDEETWPGVTSLQDWNPAFPIWPPVKLTKFCATMDEAGLDLLEVRQAGRQSRPAVVPVRYAYHAMHVHTRATQTDVPSLPHTPHRAEAGGAGPQGPDIGQGRTLPPALRRGGQAAVPAVSDEKLAFVCRRAAGVVGGVWLAVVVEAVWCGGNGGGTWGGMGGDGGGDVCARVVERLVLIVQQWKGQAGGGGR